MESHKEVRAGELGDLTVGMLFRAMGLGGITKGSKWSEKRRRLRPEPSCTLLSWFREGASKWDREGIVSKVVGKQEEYDFLKAKGRWRFQKWDKDGYRFCGSEA